MGTILESSDPGPELPIAVFEYLDSAIELRVGQFDERPCLRELVVNVGEALVHLLPHHAEAFSDLLDIAPHRFGDNVEVSARSFLRVLDAAEHLVFDSHEARIDLIESGLGALFGSCEAGIHLIESGLGPSLDCVHLNPNSVYDGVEMQPRCSGGLCQEVAEFVVFHLSASTRCLIREVFTATRCH